jgi:hypothetical protein
MEFHVAALAIFGLAGNPLQNRWISASFRRVWPSRAPDFIMSIRVSLSALIAFLVPLVFSGCFSSSEVKSTNPTSVGQQLTDLDRAYHQGIITEKEYLKLKKAIISKND